MEVNAIAEAVILADDVLEKGGWTRHCPDSSGAESSSRSRRTAAASGLSLVVWPTLVIQRPGNERCCGERLVPALVYYLAAVQAAIKTITYVPQDAGNLGWEGIAEAVALVPNANAIVAAHEEGADAARAELCGKVRTRSSQSPPGSLLVATVRCADGLRGARQSEHTFERAKKTRSSRLNGESLGRRCRLVCSC